MTGATTDAAGRSTPPGEFAVPAPATPTLPVAGSTLRFPVRRIYCVGRNYLAHVKELGNDVKALPVFFAKAADMIVQNGSTVPYPPLTANFHHEVELVAAIGLGGTDIPVEGALDHVYGYAVGLDMTRRDLQQAAAKVGRPWEGGKSFDHSAPCSAVHPVAAVGHPRQGRIHLSVNGETRQDADLSSMMWNVAEILHHLSQQVGLAPGDLVFTGTPEGVGPVVRGDRIVAAIDGLDELSISVV
jgi:fumarylpyruvate hydrolase